MAIHRPPCEHWQGHVATSLAAGEADRPADFLDRFEHEREEEEREAIAEHVRAYFADWSPGELQEAWGA